MFGKKKNDEPEQEYAFDISEFEEKERDEKKSGLYLIKELAHSFPANDNKGYTGLKLIRDSYGVQQK